MAFGVDQDDIDIAAVGRQDRRKVIEQAGPVFRRDLHQRRGFTSVRIEAYFGHGVPLLALGLNPVSHQPLRVGLAEGDPPDHVLEPFHFGRIQVERTLGVGENERIQDETLGIRKCLGLQNIQAETRDRAGERGE